MKDQARANRLLRTFGGAGDSSPRAITEEAEVALQEAEKKTEADVDVGNIIKELISTSWGGSNEEQGKAVQLLRGLAFSDDPKSSEFMADLDKLTSGMDPKKYN